MLYCSYALLAFGAGWVFTTYAMREYRLGDVEALLVGGGIGLVCAHAVLLLLMLFLPFAVSFDLSLALVAGSFLYPFFFWLKGFQPLGQRIRAQFSLLSTRSDWRTSIIACALLVAVLVWYADVYFDTLVHLPDGGYAAAFAGYGDVPYHMAQISHLAAGKTLMLDDVTYAGLPLKYPFFINFISAIFLRLGAPLIVAFHFPGFFFGSAGIVLLYFLFRRLARSRAIAFGGVILALFASNTRYLLIFQDPFFSVRHSLGETLTHLGHLPFEVGTKWNATFPNQNVDMTALLPLFFLHQRASIMGFWSMLAVLTLWTALVDGPSDQWRQKLRTASAPMAALLALFPLLHTHGFVALCFAATGWVIFSLIRKQDQARALIRSLLGVSPFLLWEIAYFIAGHYDYRFRPHFRIGWMTNPSEPGGILLDPTGKERMIISWLRLMWQNFGVLLPLFLVGTAVLLFRYRRGLCRDHLWLFVPGSLLLLVIPNLVKFQAWDFDTNKFFLFATIFEVAVLMMLFGELSKTRPRLAKVLLVATVAAAIPTGLLDMYARTTLIGPPRARLFDKGGIQVGSWVWTTTRPQAVFVTSDSHLNPVNSLGGRSVILGFKGWLWSHGVSYENRDRVITAFLNSPGAHRDELGTLGAHYVLLDPQWRDQYPQLEEKLYRDFGVPVFSAGQFKIWKF